ncbi:MAG: type II toxin-antitoxin system HicA family toxin [bacterium]|nr:type II toxin-antitoxin system HicA family toxin [bacterium]
MPRPYATHQIIKVLECQGFIFVSQRGSHAKYRKSSSRTVLTAIVPIHGKEIPYGTFRSILRQTRLKESDFYGN